jgi:hypothetical protein
MATRNIQPISVVKTVSGNSPFTMAYPEAASQTFKKGAVVVFNASGYIVEAGTDPVGIVGVAAQDAHSYSAVDSVKNRVLVWIANDDTVFEANLWTSQTTDLRDVGRAFGITLVGTNWTLDKTKLTSTKVGIIVGLEPLHDVGDVQGREHFMFYAPVTKLMYTS